MEERVTHAHSAVLLPLQIFIVRGDCCLTTSSDSIAADVSVSSKFFSLGSPQLC